MWTPTPPLAGQRTPRPGPVRVCLCSSVLAWSGGLASRARFGAPHLFLRPLCLSARPPPGCGCPFCGSLVPVPPLLPPLFFSCCSGFRAPPLSLSFFGFRPRVPWALVPCFSFLLPSRLVFFLPPVPLLSLAFSCFRPRVPWALALCAVCFVGSPLLGFSCALASLVFPAWPLAALWWFLPPPPPLFCFSLFFSLPLCAPFFLFFSLRVPVVSRFCCFPAPGALGLGAVCFLLCWPPAPRLFVRCRLFCVFCLAFGCSLVVAAPAPPLLCLAVFLAAALSSVLFFLFFVCSFSLRAPVVSGFLWFPAPGALGHGACVPFLLGVPGVF